MSGKLSPSKEKSAREQVDESCEKQTPTCVRSLRALDSLAFFLADIQGGVGPFLVIFLSASLDWNPARIGTIMFVSGIAGVVAQTPAGYLIDRVRPKRWIMAIAAALIAVACLLIALFPAYPVILSAQSFIGVAGAFFGPALAAISLGLVGRKNMEPRMGRNQSISSAGNVGMALGAGLIGYFMGRHAIFYFVAVMSVATIISVLTIREEDIDHKLARGADNAKKNEKGQLQLSGIAVLLKDHRVLIFALSAILFHFANASLLTLVGQVLSSVPGGHPSLYMSATIIVAQLVIIPIGFIVGRRAKVSKRKRIYLIAFMVLPLRCLLYIVSQNSYYLVALQIFDGIGTGIFGIMQILVIADLTKGTGRFNLTQGALGTAVGIGASLSNLLAGFVVKRAGYNAGFLTMAAIAGLALALFWFLMPETKMTDGQATLPAADLTPVMT
jgi:MFS family permease